MVYGVIFAGGYGKRLRPITDRIPKVMIEIRRNYTILDRQLLDFKYSGINTVYLLVGYKHKIIKRKYGNEWKGIKLIYLVERKPMGTLWALRNCALHADDDIVVRNGDTISDFNIRRMVEIGSKKKFEALIAITPMKSPYAIVELEGERIVRFVEKPYIERYVNAGLYYFKKDVLKHLHKEYQEKEIEKTFIPEIVSLGLAGAYIEEAGWFPVDNFKDLEELRKEYRNRRDREFGYVKNQGNGMEIYVKASYRARIRKVGRVIIAKGKGILNGREMVQGESVDVNSPWEFLALENSKINLISL